LLRRYVANNHQTAKKIAGKGFNAVAPEGEECPWQCRNLTKKCGKEKKFIALNSVPMKIKNKFK
jgi:hypothetical protein